jgi:hypothetical protein
MAEQRASPSHKTLLLAELENLDHGIVFTTEICALVERSPFFQSSLTPARAP